MSSIYDYSLIRFKLHKKTKIFILRMNILFFRKLYFRRPLKKLTILNFFFYFQ